MKTSWPIELQYLAALLAHRWDRLHGDRSRHDRGASTLEYIVIAAIGFGLALAAMTAFGNRVREYIGKLG